MVFILINCEQGKEASIIEKLYSIKSIKEIQQISGNYDIIVKLEAITVDIIKETINWKIRKIDGIHSTTTLLCLPLSTENRQDVMEWH
ncbi:MAG: Lrp/AsnC ligand binding domain-containing protein [Thaumarchaeota archaeon]|nr:Lrp/AsnC ligand binding domain-containing protein [Nitrososphaerota archaeon]MDE1831533.1 Lrp/AsnC ligand binding domain-containing protein [Nitrososphaerota archaeon]MDE1841580.1 Lrp/AsnC ligand binding domain-containing protein [Nitrososphaerota archaeon]MDE1877492.1 Lrp/AsnC ligand binding domain-containing protein [Nitrososphaerota archaeon]